MKSSNASRSRRRPSISCIYLVPRNDNTTSCGLSARQEAVSYPIGSPEHVFAKKTICQKTTCAKQSRPMNISSSYITLVSCAHADQRCPPPPLPPRVRKQGWPLKRTSRRNLGQQRPRLMQLGRVVSAADRLRSRQGKRGKQRENGQGQQRRVSK